MRRPRFTSTALIPGTFFGSMFSMGSIRRRPGAAPRRHSGCHLGVKTAADEEPDHAVRGDTRVNLSGLVRKFVGVHSGQAARAWGWVLPCASIRRSRVRLCR
jgi:hypothetical protein